jgi:hypothetical protein
MEYPITRTIQFFIDNPSQNYGVVIAAALDDPTINHKLNGTDTVYQGYCFAGAVPYVDSLKAYKPQLEIVYNENSGINDDVSASDYCLHENISVKNKAINLSVPGDGKYRFSVYTISGKAIIKSAGAVTGKETIIKLDKTGMFIVTIVAKNTVGGRKIAVCK